MRRWLVFASLTLILHFAWEVSQATWYASMHGLPFWRATLLCARAAMGDLVIAAIAFAVAAAVAKSMTWPIRSPLATIVFVVVGLTIVVAYEVFAISTGRWRYDATMPTIFGIGLLPVLQWLLLPLVEVFAFRLIFRRRL
jgi:hypothetical protein